MDNLLKLEGRIQRLEILDDSLNALGDSGDAQITSSAILSGVTESVSLGAQTVFLASRSRLHVKSVVLEINDVICVGQFHRALFEENEYVICVARKIENNLYELYSVLSPKTGLLHMQVGMGASVDTFNKSAKKGGIIWYVITMIISSILALSARGFNSDTIIMILMGSILFYIVLMLIINNVSNSLKHFSEKSEKIFEIYKFENPEKVFLLPSRHINEHDNLLLESVFEYRQIIKNDPYPESYIEQKERNE